MYQKEGWLAALFLETAYTIAFSHFPYLQEIEPFRRLSAISSGPHIKLETIDNVLASYINGAAINPIPRGMRPYRAARPDSAVAVTTTVNASAPTI